MKKTLLLLFVFSIGTAAYCKTWVISSSGVTFTPATVTIAPGDSVNFSLGSSHNVVEVSQATWNANGNTTLPGFSEPFGGGLLLPSQLTVGTHYFVCVPHASMGMKGTIIVQSVATGVEDNVLNTGISVYPNPSDGKFQIDIDNSHLGDKVYLEIYTMHGNKIFEATTQDLQQSNLIDLSRFPEGFYIVTFYVETGTAYKKIIILR